MNKAQPCHSGSISIGQVIAAWYVAQHAEIPAKGRPGSVTLAGPGPAATKVDGAKRAVHLPGPGPIRPGNPPGCRCSPQSSVTTRSRARDTRMQWHSAVCPAIGKILEGAR